MVLQEEAAPQVLRLLRGAAELLSPQVRGAARSRLRPVARRMQACHGAYW